jgi:hypothetical protein
MTEFEQDELSKCYSCCKTWVDLGLVGLKYLTPGNSNLHSESRGICLECYKEFTKCYIWEEYTVLPIPFRDLELLEDKFSGGIIL